MVRKTDPVSIRTEPRKRLYGLKPLTIWTNLRGTVGHLAAILVRRTAKEEHRLARYLPSYADYAIRVR